MGQVQNFSRKLRDWGIPIVLPIGGHGIFLDALAFLPQVPQEQCPAQSLAAAIYVDSGVRTIERGIVSTGRDPQTGEEHKPSLELVRIALPRRVYPQAHMDVTTESILSVYEERDSVGGLKIFYDRSTCAFSRHVSLLCPRLLESTSSNRST